MSTENQEGNGQAPAQTKFDFPMGSNPFFPEDAQAEAQDLSPEEGEETVEPSSPDAEQSDDYQAQEDEPEPTFNEEEDAAAGIDVSSEEYKHFQRAFTKRTQALKAQTPEKPSSPKQPLRPSVESQTAPEKPAPAFAYSVDFKDFQAPKLGEDSPLAGYEQEVLKLVAPAIQHAVETVNRQSQQFVEQTHLQQTQTYLTEVVEEIEARGGEEARDQALAMLKEYGPIAKADPVKWARFVVSSLGLVGSEPTRKAAPSSPARNNQQTARQVRGQVTKPNAPSSATSRTPAFSGKTATRDAVAWSLEQQLRGR